LSIPPTRTCARRWSFERFINALGIPQVVALSYLIDPDTPKNDGTFRPITVVAKPGTVVWANPGAPVTLATNQCAQEILEAIIKALAPACPDRAMAGWGRRFRIAIQGKDPRSGSVPFLTLGRMDRHHHNIWYGHMVVNPYLTLPKVDSTICGRALRWRPRPSSTHPPRIALQICLLV
jgi:hypothetical protein